MVGDATKVTVFLGYSLLDGSHRTLTVLAIPSMILAVAMGRKLNRRLGEKGYAALFWTVMAGYSLRLVFLRLV